MLRRCIAGVLGAALPWSMPPGAAAEPEPQPRVGEVREYRERLLTVDCRRWVTTEVTLDVVVSRCGGYRLELSRAHQYGVVRLIDGDGAAVVEFSPALPDLQFPLAVGRRWSGDYRGYHAGRWARWRGHMECRVAAFEPLTLAFGTADAYRIECLDRWSVGPFQGRRRSTRWFAPDQGGVVKAVSPDDPAWDAELVRFTPAP